MVNFVKGVGRTKASSRLMPPPADHISPIPERLSDYEDISSVHFFECSLCIEVQPVRVRTYDKDEHIFPPAATLTLEQ